MSVVSMGQDENRNSEVLRRLNHSTNWYAYGATEMLEDVFKDSTDSVEHLENWAF